MDDIELKLAENNRGVFVIEKEGERLAEMEIAISGNNLTVYHTEVSKELRDHGIAGKLVSNMVAHAREHKLKVIALTHYPHMVLLQIAARLIWKVLEGLKV